MFPFYGGRELLREEPASPPQDIEAEEKARFPEWTTMRSHLSCKAQCSRLVCRCPQVAAVHAAELPVFEATETVALVLK